jgi:hypothetical protein
VSIQNLDEKQFKETHVKSPLGIQYTYKVDAFEIDELIRNGNIRQPEFIKLDIRRRVIGFRRDEENSSKCEGYLHKFP